MPVSGIGEARAKAPRRSKTRCSGTSGPTPEIVDPRRTGDPSTPGSAGSKPAIAPAFGEADLSSEIVGRSYPWAMRSELRARPARWRRPADHEAGGEGCSSQREQRGRDHEHRAASTWERGEVRRGKALSSAAGVAPTSPATSGVVGHARSSAMSEIAAPSSASVRSRNSVIVRPLPVGDSTRRTARSEADQSPCRRDVTVPG